MEQIVWARDIFHHILYFPTHKVAQTSSSKAALVQRLAPTSASVAVTLGRALKTGRPTVSFNGHESGRSLVPVGGHIQI